jgi:hypothetical protein
MEIDSPTINDNSGTSVNASVLKTVSWNTDIGIASLSKDLFSQLKYYQEKATDAGEADSDLPEYKQPKDLITTNTKLNQRLCFNSIRCRGTVSDIPSNHIISVNNIRSAATFMYLLHFPLMKLYKNPNSKNGLTLIDTSCVCAQAMQKKWLKL